MFANLEMTSTNKLRDWLVGERTSRGWSQRELGIKIGLTNTAISEIEKGTVSARTLFILSAFFEMSIKTLWEWAEMEKDEKIERILEDWDKASPDERQFLMHIIRLLKL